MNQAYFSYDPEEGFKFHTDKNLAKVRARACIEEARSFASDGWDVDGVKQICWGKITEVVVETKRYPAPEGSEFDEFLEFDLRSTEDIFEIAAP